MATRKMEEAALTSHKEKALAAAKRMKTTSRPSQTVKTWAKHMRAVIAEAALIGGKPE